jgi:hypothetical protein
MLGSSFDLQSAELSVVGFMKVRGTIRNKRLGLLARDLLGKLK